MLSDIFRWSLRLTRVSSAVSYFPSNLFILSFFCSFIRTACIFHPSVHLSLHGYQQLKVQTVFSVCKRSRGRREGSYRKEWRKVGKGVTTVKKERWDFPRTFDEQTRRLSPQCLPPSPLLPLSVLQTVPGFVHLPLVANKTSLSFSSDTQRNLLTWLLGTYLSP